MGLSGHQSRVFSFLRIFRLLPNWCLCVLNSRSCHSSFSLNIILNPFLFLFIPWKLISCRFSATSFIFNRGLRYSARDRTLCTSKQLWSCFAWWCCRVEWFINLVHLMLATVPDRNFGSGSGSKLHRRQIGSPGRQATQTVHLGTVWWYTPNQSELGGLTAGRSAGAAIDSNKPLVFAVC